MLSKSESEKKDPERIHGFEIELNDDKLSRIDRLVKNYEQKIASRLDEEYETSTKRSDRIADKVASFGEAGPSSSPSAHFWWYGF
jgi:uncharacterized membrane protein